MTKRNRRNFMRDTAVVGAGAMTAPTLLTTLTAFEPATSAAQTASASAPLDVAEWSFFNRRQVFEVVRGWIESKVRT